MTYAPAHGAFAATWLLIAFPLAGAAITLLGGRYVERFGHYLATLLSGASFVLGFVLFLEMRAKPSADRHIHQVLWNWIDVGHFQVNSAVLLDPLSMVFVLLITGVGSLILVYSLGYMAHDPKRRRFFGYMDLFIASMLFLVLADSYLGLYVGWEGVGLCSYLLIGFWQYKPTAATAAKKAFIVNRVGDVGLSLAIMLMFAALDRVDFAGVFGRVHGASHADITGIALLLLLGACGKSAQVPLQSWLSDAMEGPTPVSALIHAATMVTAGVYLIARSAPIFDLSPNGRLLVTIVGAVTLMYGAICGCANDDIKKVLAYSTISQIGYMILAVGLGPAGYAIAILHLVAHGFFKATMFLGAGSVMHGMNDQVDMRRFGGLRSVMPVTFWTFMMGYLAIIGFPFWSGFWTKDKIIEASFDKGGISGYVLGITALLGAGVTAFYMTRLMIMTFFGERRWTDDVHPHESPAVMTVPMVLLGIGSAIGGYFLIFGGDVQHWLTPVLGRSAEEGVHTVNKGVLTAITLVVMAGGIFGAYVAQGRARIPWHAPQAGPVVRAARANLYGDAFNESVFMRPGQYLTRVLVFFDNRGIDGVVNGLAAIVGGGSGRLRRSQTGFVRSYALSMSVGAVLLAAALLLVKAG